MYFYFALNKYHFTLDYWNSLDRYEKALYKAMIDERVEKDKKQAEKIKH